PRLLRQLPPVLAFAGTQEPLQVRERPPPRFGSGKPSADPLPYCAQSLRPLLRCCCRCPGLFHGRYPYCPEGNTFLSTPVGLFTLKITCSVRRPERSNLVPSNSQAINRSKALCGGDPMCPPLSSSRRLNPRILSPAVSL